VVLHAHTSMLWSSATECNCVHDRLVQCIRQCEVLLDGLYGKTGDRRFYHARDTLIHGLDDDLLSVDVGLL
jgi:hypothetical protein